MRKYYLAIDVGASSGRHIVGYVENGEIKIDEVFRFQNGMTAQNGSLVWDIDKLFSDVKSGIKAAFESYPAIESLAIDTWGVDYVLMNGDKEILPAYAYRDGRTRAAIKRTEEIISFSELYRRTGIQFAPYNTVYQLMDDLENGRLAEATDFLMMPEYLSYKLTGVKKREYTEATTTGLVNAYTKKWDKELINKLGLPLSIFGEISFPSETVGTLKPNIAGEVGGNLKVKLCASHDTASAADAAPTNEHDLFLSSGTWSLLGAKLLSPVIDENSLNGNFANEGGSGYICYLKNIMGMWVVNELKKELCPDASFVEIVSEARNSKFFDTVDVNEDAFMAPESMKAVFDSRVKPVTMGDYFNCAFRSLAKRYAETIAEIERSTGKRYERLYIVGGGAKNEYLNELTALYSGKKVIAMPIEATAIGNIKSQIE